MEAAFSNVLMLSRLTLHAYDAELCKTDQLHQAINVSSEQQTQDLTWWCFAAPGRGRSKDILLCVIPAGRVPANHRPHDHGGGRVHTGPPGQERRRPHR